MKIENPEVYGFRRSIYAMRNPLNSWDKSDSHFRTPGTVPLTYRIWPWGCIAEEQPNIGPDDMKLLTGLVARGPEHAKNLRMIHIWVDLSIPRYIWQELDTYKISTVRMSCSTRPGALKKGFLTVGDFEGGCVSQSQINELNTLITQYNKTKDKELLITLKRKLPESYIQQAGYQLNYQTALNIYHQRKNHWLPEWKTICTFISSLPYMSELIKAGCSR